MFGVHIQFLKGFNNVFTLKHGQGEEKAFYYLDLN